MISRLYNELSMISNEDLLSEVVHRMENASKYDLLLGKFNSFETADGERYVIKVIKLEDNKS